MSNYPSVVIVTGAGIGIGFEVCCELAKSGSAVVLNDLSKDVTAKAVETIQQQGGNCIGVPGDASDAAIIKKLINTAVKHFGYLSAVVANAGITVYGDFLHYKRDDLHEILQTNIIGSFFIAQAAAQQMIQQDTGGSILFMSSVTGHQAHSNLVAYGMTKAALEMLAKGLVTELSPHQINVNAVAPGATLTERTQQFPDYEKIWSKVTPMGRPAYTTDIAKTAKFLISEDARHITGQTLIVDGGWTSVSPLPPPESI
ncbi:SDR family oxidoreductase [Olivibacter sp. SDN3]|uniref:SDR family NAD(P)-dependent oxidoreductase n=1 Tax=Olivibacter sp. SDN3 TaxID=2764720 RepID=UPI0016513F3B|nr:SDR family oxidoreductase [Olivibacter sp. SDN3]QNL50459.1 SDR family oxidoreductase [Olivibacter sp. SDN3]